MQYFSKISISPLGISADRYIEPKAAMAWSAGLTALRTGDDKV